MPFIDIAFEAEVSKYEDAEFLELARLNCNEIPGTRSKAINELRHMIREQGECSLHRIDDDAYLLRFLRCRQFIPARAHRLMVRYETFRDQNKALYLGVDPFEYKMKNFFLGTYPDSPEHGRIGILDFNEWDPKTVSLQDVMTMALAIMEMMVRQPRIQVMGITLIVDLSSLGLLHVRYLSTTIIEQVSNLLGMGFPALIHSIHVINGSRLIRLVKSFLPAGVLGLIHVHGLDFASLHKFIDPSLLPTKYGGTRQQLVTNSLWLDKIKKYKDEAFDREFREMGYSIE